MFPNPWYRPPWEGGKSAERVALAWPREAKNASFAVFWSCGGWLRFGVDTGELDAEPNEAGDEESLRRGRPGLGRPEARALRSPWAEEGREGGFELLLDAPKPAGLGDIVHDLPATSASNWLPLRLGKEILRCV